MGAASALRRLRIADVGIHLAITPDNLDTLTALRSLTFLSVTKALSAPHQMVFVCASSCCCIHGASTAKNGMLLASHVSSCKQRSADSTRR